jgi:hypothetical protein
MSSLATETLSFGDSHAPYTCGVKRVFHFVEFERLDDRGH